MGPHISKIDELIKLPKETEWAEFKKNSVDPKDIGDYICMLANSACLCDKTEAYLVYGIDDETHEVVGTTFDPQATKGKGNEDLVPWLHRLLNPLIDFEIQIVPHPRGRVVLFYIQATSMGPVSFEGREYIRIESHKKNLKDYPDLEAKIWSRRHQFEDRVSTHKKHNGEEVLNLLDYAGYFRLEGSPLPQTKDAVLSILKDRGFVFEKGGYFYITNAGAILLAHNLSNFSELASKTVRVITYEGVNKLKARKEKEGVRGYAIGFEKLVEYIKDQAPEFETISGALRTGSYPLEVFREFVANALVHQDFSAVGSRVTISIFNDRVELYNPGSPLVEVNRFLDSDKSRNEKLGSLLRKMRICEQRGSGVDRAMNSIEISQLPSPKIEADKNGVTVTIYAKRKLEQLTKDERCRACYWHSCLKYVASGEAMTNGSLCKRLGISEQNKAVASRIIKSSIEKGYIRPFDPESTSNRFAKYVPFWVSSS